MDGYESFIENLTQICDSIIPKSSGRPRKHNPWFCNECRVALQEKKRTYKIAKRNPIPANIYLFQQSWAKARRVFRENEWRSFRDLVSKLSSQTFLTKVWRMIKRLKGTERDSINHILRPDGSRAETEEAIAKALIERLSHNSSSAHHTPSFRNHTQ